MFDSRRGAALAAAALVTALGAGVARADHELVHGMGYLGTGYTVFSPTRASLRDPHFGMRFFLSDPAPGTLARLPEGGTTDAQAADASDGRHFFWDVAFGERLPLVGWYDVRDAPLIRYARGVQLNLDAGAFMLLDFESQSSGVINTDYRLGGSLDFRPWVHWAERFSGSVGFFHQSTHLGDEYVLSAATIQNHQTPAVNSRLPFRANPSYNAFPVTLSWDWSPAVAWQLRAYGGTMLFLDNEIRESDHPEYRVGVEVQFDRLVSMKTPRKASPRDLEKLGTQGPPPAEGAASPAQAAPPPDDFLDSIEQFGFGHSPIGQATPPPDDQPRYRRGPLSFALKYELLLQKRFRHLPPEPGPAAFEPQSGTWKTHHLMLLAYLNTNTPHSTSNAFVGGLEFIHGQNQHGQLVSYHQLSTVALSISYYW